MLEILTITLAPVAAFVVGTITPTIVRRFSFEGFEVRQLTDYIVISETEAGGLIFSTALKVANGTARTLILSEVNCPTVTDFAPQRIELQRLVGRIALPPTTLDYPPLAVPPDTEMVLGLAIWFSKHQQVQKNQRNRKSASATLQTHLLDGYRLRIRLNGKSRHLPIFLRANNP